VKGYLSKWAQAMLKGKFGFQDYGSMQVRIDQKGKPLSSSDLETMAKNKNFITEGKKVNLQFKELKDLQDRPLIPEAKKIMRMIKYLTEDSENNKIKKAKRELELLKKSEKLGKLTDLGKRRKEVIIDFLYSRGIFDV
jgi:hypothetical protein